MTFRLFRHRQLRGAAAVATAVAVTGALAVALFAGPASGHRSRSHN